jgi:hypothetical protein
MKISDSLRVYITSCLPGHAAKAAPLSSPKITWSLTNRISNVLHLLRHKLFYKRPLGGRYDHESRQSASIPAWAANSPRLSASSAQALSSYALDASIDSSIHSPSPPAMRHSPNSANLQVKSQRVSRNPAPENVQKLLAAIQTADTSAMSAIENLPAIVNTLLRCPIKCIEPIERFSLRMPSPLELAVHHLAYDESGSAVTMTDEAAGNRMKIIEILAKAGARVHHLDSWGSLVKNARIALTKKPSGGLGETYRNRDRFLNHISAMCVSEPLEQTKSAFVTSRKYWSESLIKELIGQFEQLKNSEHADPARLDKMSCIYVSLFQHLAALKIEQQQISTKVPKNLAHERAIRIATSTNSDYRVLLERHAAEIYELFLNASHLSGKNN